jgi:magnesium-transporting ATPase (P-type)
VKWHELQVGDFIQVKNRTTLPADVAAISVAEKSEQPTGVCYVETKSLDGETNLKIRNACACTYSKVRGGQSKYRGANSVSWRGMLTS